MHIIHVNFERHWGGGEIALRSLYYGLHALGCRQTILCRDASQLKIICQKEGLPYRVIDRSLGISWITARLVHRICCDEQADLINVHDTKSHHALFIANRCFVHKLPYVVTRRLAFPVRPSWYNRLRYADQYLKSVIAVSQAAKASMDRVLTADKPLHIINEGIDIAQIRHRARRVQKPLRIAIVGRLSPEKGHETFVNMVAWLIKKGFSAQFDIVGQGAMADTLIKKIDTLGLSQHVKMLGFVHHIYDYLSQIDMLIMPSISEAFGLSIIDAMACGVVVIASEVGGIREIITHGHNGMLASPYCHESFAKYVIHIAHDHTLWEKLMHNGYQTVQRFDLKNTHSQIYQLYQQVMR